MQQEFINIAAHELRTPIQPILSLSEVLLSKRGNIEEYDDFLKGINRNAKRLHRLAENILDVTKIESQSLHLKKQRFSLNDIIQSVLTDYQRLVDSSKVRLAMTPNDDIAIVEGDKERFNSGIRQYTEQCN